MNIVIKANQNNKKPKRFISFEWQFFLFILHSFYISLLKYLSFPNCDSSQWTASATVNELSVFYVSLFPSLSHNMITFRIFSLKNSKCSLSTVYSASNARLFVSNNPPSSWLREIIIAYGIKWKPQFKTILKWIVSCSISFNCHFLWTQRTREKKTE